jgi:hypothetical protein
MAFVPDQPSVGKFVPDAPTEPPTPKASNTQATIGGAYKGLADIAGGPVDLATMGLNVIPGVNIKEPFMGSDWWKGKLKSEKPQIYAEPESGVGKLLGGLTEAGVSLVGPAIGSFGKAASKVSTAEQVIKDMKDAGYVMPPSQGGGGAVARTLEGFAGKAKTSQLATVKNQEVTNALAADDLHLPKGAEITDEVLKNLRAAYGQAYEAVKSSVKAIKLGPSFNAQVDKIGSDFDEARKAFPDLVGNKDIDTLRKTLKDTPQASPRALVELGKSLRFNATSNLKSFDDPAKRALGLAQRDASNLIDDHIEKSLSSIGQADLVKDFKEARTMIAKSHDYESAIDPSGNVSARAMASLERKGKPLSGNAQTIATFGAQFPKSAQNLGVMGGYVPDSLLDAALAGVGYAAGGIPGVAAGMARPVLRNALLSQPVQRGLPQGLKNAAGAVDLANPLTAGSFAALLQQVGK